MEGDAGGVYCDEGSPRFRDCIISGNTAGVNGGGVVCWESDAQFIGCTIRENEAGARGGAVDITLGSPVLTDCTIDLNAALGEFAFGQPSRITATVRLGEGRVIDIERETELGGAIHSKGVLILSSLLGARYARDLPLSLSASLVFEQSYGGVDGDSASVAEFVALVSAIARLPVRQSLAVTGSVDQHGRVQAIGGVNQKIEGFFDVCNARGLTGDQGVLIPADNVQHLMLREDVVAAIERGDFRVYPLASVDEAMSLLIGREAGARDADGRFPATSVNGRVDAALRGMAERRRSFTAKAHRSFRRSSGNDSGT